MAEIVEVHFLESTVLRMALGVEFAGLYPSLPSLDEFKQYVIDKNPRLRQKKVFNLICLTVILRSTVWTMICRSGSSLCNPGRQAGRGGIYHCIEILAGMESICDGYDNERIGPGFRTFSRIYVSCRCSFRLI